MPEIATMTGHSLADARPILDKNHFHRDPRLSDAGVDEVDAMLSAMASVANDVPIGVAPESRQPNGVIGRKRQAREGRRGRLIEIFSVCKNLAEDMTATAETLSGNNGWGGRVPSRYPAFPLAL